MYFSVFGSTIQFMATLLVQGPRTIPPPMTVALFVGRRPRPPLSSAAILPGILQAASRVSNKRSGEAVRERALARGFQVALHAVPRALSAARRVQAAILLQSLYAIWLIRGASKPMFEVACGRGGGVVIMRFFSKVVLGALLAAATS